MHTNFKFPLATILVSGCILFCARVQGFTPVTSQIIKPLTTVDGATLAQTGANFVILPPYRSAALPTEVKSSVDSSSSVNDAKDIVGRRIVVRGDVNGGYVRTCVINEASRFRKLIGTMSPPEDTDTAEIYVEGKRKNVEGFIRWCERGSKSVGLSQKFEVMEILEEDPTGMYDDFYAKTGRP